MSKALVLLAIASSASACQPTSSSQPAAALAASSTHAVSSPSTLYRLHIDPELERLTLQLCAEGYLAEGKLAPSKRARPHLSRSHRDEEGCLVFEVTIPPGSTFPGMRDPVRRGQSMLLSPDLWLWEATTRPANSPVELELQKDSADLVVPWPSLGDRRWRIPEGQFNEPSMAAIGAMTRFTLDYPEGAFQVAVLGDITERQQGELSSWLTRAVDAQQTVLSPFPSASHTLLVAPMPGRRAPFGYVVPGGGPTITVLMPSDFDEAQLRRDWMLVHELNHIEGPDFPRSEAWFYEGIATYYASVARARAGYISREQAWTDLFDGFARGKRTLTGDTLERDSRRMRETNAYWRVYWGGTAFVLAADLELRRRGRSFDWALQEMRRCCSNERNYKALELLEHLDAKLEDDLLVPLAREHLKRTEFDDLAAWRDSLGIERTGSALVRLHDEAADAALRRGILTRQRPGVAAGPASP